MEALKADYIAQHRGHFNSSDDSEDEDPIDVVGDDTNDESSKTSLDDEFIQRNSSKSNPFSIDSLLKDS